MTKREEIKTSIFRKDTIFYIDYYGYETINGVPIDLIKGYSEEALKFINSIRRKPQREIAND